MFKGVVCYFRVGTSLASRVLLQLYASSVFLFTDRAGIYSFIRNLGSIEYRRKKSKITDVRLLGRIRNEKASKGRALRVIPKGQANRLFHSTVHYHSGLIAHRSNLG